MTRFTWTLFKRTKSNLKYYNRNVGKVELLHIFKACNKELHHSGVVTRIDKLVTIRNWCIKLEIPAAFQLKNTEYFSCINTCNSFHDFEKIMKIYKNINISFCTSNIMKVRYMSNCLLL